MKYLIPPIARAWRRFVPRTYPVTLKPSLRKSVGRVLLSYREESVALPFFHPALLQHSSYWESREIARIFLSLGYQVDAVNFADRDFMPQRQYDMVFDIFENLGRWADTLNRSTLKFLHLTGSDPNYQNAAEFARVEDVNRRRNGSYLPKRQIERPDATYRSIEAADICSLLGNEHTKSTYPDRYARKMNLVTVSSTVIHRAKKQARDFVPEEREFLWFFGSGMVHKGLDRTLEVFARNPQLCLHVVGSMEDEFFSLYKKELTSLDNIHFHGFLLPSSREFKEIISNAFCFIAPTCSEGISPAVTTCLQIGLYPILSRDTGVTLPDGCGYYLETCSIDEIERLALAAFRMPVDQLVGQIKRIQVDALSRFSRVAFRQQMFQHIARSIRTFASGNEKSVY